VTGDGVEGGPPPPESALSDRAVVEWAQNEMTLATNLPDTATKAAAAERAKLLPVLGSELVPPAATSARPGGGRERPHGDHDLGPSPVFKSRE
jgi:hypothetical protein